ncbi:hypothetical protein S245_071250, partial [Arachis hypogaea]
ELSFVLTKASNLVSPRIFNSVFNPCHHSNTIRLHSQLNSHSFQQCHWQERKQGDGRYHGDWTSNYDVSLQDLQLQDLIDDNEQHKDAQLFIKLNIQKVVPEYFILMILALSCVRNLRVQYY